MLFCVTDLEIKVMNEDEFRERMLEALTILNDINLQNQIIAELPSMSEEFLPPCANERYAMGDVDEWPNSEGEFGRTPTNPILVNQTWGEITYLSRLLTTDNQRMIFHRIGSVEGAIDAFELVSEDGKFFDVLFVDMYHNNCSKKSPVGYSLLEFLDGITGTSENNYAFPSRVEETLFETAINKFGAPIISPAVFNFDEKQATKLIAMVRNGNNLEGKILGTFSV